MKVLQVDMLEEDFSLQEFTPREQLVHALRQARDEIAALKEEVDKLCAPPSTYGVYLSAHDDDTVDILAQAMKVLPVDMLGEDFSTTTTPSMCWRKVAR